jgi:DNA repair protein RadC
MDGHCPGQPLAQPILRHGSVAALGTDEASRLGRKALRRRSARLNLFGPDLGQDGVWNILLELLIAQGEGRLTPIKCLWLASGLPQSTALRWVNYLVSRGYAHRKLDPSDGRRQFITLDDDLELRLVQFLRETEE